MKNVVGASYMGGCIGMALRCRRGVGGKGLGRRGREGLACGGAGRHRFFCMGGAMVRRCVGGASGGAAWVWDGGRVRFHLGVFWLKLVVG